MKIAPKIRNGIINPTIARGDADGPEVLFVKDIVRKVEKKESM